MDAREYLNAVRSAVNDRRAALLMLETVGIRSGAKVKTGTIGDPTGSMALAIIKAERECSERLASLDAFIAGGVELIAGISAALGDEYGAIMSCYYIRAEPWDKVAQNVSRSRRSCINMRDTALDWVDAVGFARAREGKGVAT